MQVVKDNTRKLLLNTARKAFLQKGYKAVSMREISKLSGIGLSNIYNYFSSKDELLTVVLRPLLNEMDRMLERHNKPDGLSLDIFTSEDYIRSSLNEIMRIVTNYHQEIKLLFLYSQSSMYQDYLDKWIDRCTEKSIEYMRGMRERYPELNTDISRFFLRYTSSCWIDMMKETALHEELSHEETERFLNEYVRYVTGGWKKLMNVE
ncbi:MAG: TetR/AcrR family transcriptional regulator [Prevotella sp.]|nr:TetR/AcrR family transcriptional regulator [Prevotella sp.]